MNLIKLNLKIVFISLLVLIVVAAAGYKYYEWNALNSLANQYNKAWKEEIALSEAIDKTSNDMYSILTEENDESSQNEKASDSEKIDKAISKTKLLVDQAEHYFEVTEQNQKNYQQLSSQTNFLLGDKKEFAKGLFNLQFAYYAKDMESSKSGLAVAHFLYNYFILGKEAQTLQDFQVNAHGDESYYANHLNDIAVFRKYTDENYKFPHQDEIKKYSPKANNLLEQTKKFYATFYSVMEDYAKGDKDSAAYKAEKLPEYAVALNVDPQEIVADTLEKAKKDTKANIETIAKQTMLIKNLEKSGELRYPLLPTVQNFDSNLVMCMAYITKTSSIYFDIMDSYPKAENTNELLRDLNVVSPQTSEIDKLFDTKTLTVSNADKKITMTCSDSTKDKKFIFETIKNETK